MSRRDPGGDPVDPRVSLLQRLERWQTSEHAALVARLILLELPVHGLESGRDRYGLEPGPLGGGVLGQGRPLVGAGDQSRGERLLRPGGRAEGLLESPPWLLVPLSRPTAGERFGPGAARADGFALVELSEAYLGEHLLPGLAEIHFGPLDEGDYAVAVLRQDGSLLYGSDPDLSPEELMRSDVRLPLATRPGLAPRARRPAGRRAPLRRGPAHGGGPPEDISPVGFGGAGAPWVLMVRHRGGSLAQAVAAARRRNLAVGMGILALLGVTGALLVVGAQRARTLARQQLEFVAGVTPELHTPLAAVRAAGQNLADGVVSEAGQVRRYGDLIQKEGRRLGALVARVLDFAGIESGSRADAVEAVSLAPLVEAVVGDLGLVLEQARMNVEVHVPDDLPQVQVDPGALRRALENLLVNAAKFAASG